MSGYVLAIDQGTTSSRAIIFDGAMQVVASSQKEFLQRYPASGGRVDPDETPRVYFARLRRQA